MLKLCKQCGKEFEQTTSRKIYCDIVCSDKAQHRKMRERARLGRLTTAYEQEHVMLANQADEARWRQAKTEIKQEAFSNSLRDVLGYVGRPADIPVPDSGLDKDELKPPKLTKVTPLKDDEV